MESLQKSRISEQQSHVIIDTTEIPEAALHEATHWERGQFIIEFIILLSSRVLPIEALIFSGLLLSSCLNQKICCNDHASLSFTTAVQMWIMSYIDFTSFHCKGRYELNKLTLFPRCGFIAQLVEHRTGIAEVTGSTPVETLIFFGLLPSNNYCFNWKIYSDDHSSLSKKYISKLLKLVWYFSVVHIRNTTLPTWPLGDTKI